MAGNPRSRSRPTKLCQGHGLRDCNSGCLCCVVLPDFRGLQVIGEIVGGSPTMTQDFSKPATTLLRASQQLLQKNASTLNVIP
jgi:hypothetical protein